MAEKIYWCANSAMATTAAAVKQPTGTAIRTMLQIAPPVSTNKIAVCEWGISFDGSAAGVPIQCELVETNVAATAMTAHVAAGVQPYNDAGAPASTVQLGTGLTAFSTAAVTEGATTSSRYGDLQLIAPTNQYVKTWPPGREFEVQINRFLRVRVTAAASVNCYTYVMWIE